jgi:hypothetical protein
MGEVRLDERNFGASHTLCADVSGRWSMLAPRQGLALANAIVRQQSWVRKLVIRWMSVEWKHLTVQRLLGRMVTQE